ncbi:RNA polymerase II subunit A C-terminal domain phosphatase SSU72-like [Zerene cesonia]|uniref:RNA polymerase II subunit A C-terminal domain phosphatase SSU72-like n=1 Tax=Zerene cesonia TaxID=33412 RepID=UPI0018E4FF48|nr:RNA polymerase II subunit A C-terminal domain phosphatase SSU72-like [Zerene cesonia]
MNVVCEGNVCRLVYAYDNYWFKAMSGLHFAVVCSSNMNRSMEAHAILDRKGFRVKSFGTGDRVKLPGRGNRPNCYAFGIPYMEIFNDLVSKDKNYYCHNGVLNMIIRNHKVKPCPERFQCSTERFDVIITCERRVYDQVIEWFALKQSVYNLPTYIINIDIKDNLGEATLGSYLIVELATKLSQSLDLNKDMPLILQAFENKCKKRVLNCVMYY